MKYLIILFLLVSTPCYALNLTQSCLAFYKMDDDAATTDVIDERGNNTGTGVRNTILYHTVGKVLGALDFDGADDVINVGSELIGAGAASICVWIKPTDAGENNLGRIADNGKFIYSMGINKLSCSSDGGANNPNSGTGSITYGVWSFVCVTRNSAGDKTNFYINGILKGASDQDGGTPAAGSRNLGIGDRTTGARAFLGPIDNFMIFERVLTLQEIIKLYNGGRGLNSLSTLEMEDGLE